MVHPVKRNAAIASAGRPIAAARVLAMPAMIGHAAVLGKAGRALSLSRGPRQSQLGLHGMARALSTRRMPSATAC
jgi:hypothetical protein